MSQNSSTSSSDARRFLWGFLLGALLLLLPGILLSLYLRPLSGELTRIGHLAERDFAASQPQADLLRASNNILAADADVLVIGDSFSDRNIWQTVFAEQTGLKTLTYHYDDVACLDQWLNQAMHGGLSSRARTIIIESVERNLIRRFATETAACEPASMPPRKAPAELLTEQHSRLKLFPMNILFLLQTLRNHLLMDHASSPATFDRAVMVDLTRTDLFSSARPEKLLYYAVDDERRRRFGSRENIDKAVTYLQGKQHQAARLGIRLLVVAIPDKSTVYAPWIAPGQFPVPADYDLFPRLVSTLGPEADLLTTFRSAAERQKDFYAPNGTHLTLDGYRHLGELLAHRLRSPAISH